jgi:hypothetical protein
MSAGDTWSVTCRIFAGSLFGVCRFRKEPVMLSEFKAACVLLTSFLFFLLILGLLALGSVMRPNRWSERTRPAS